jgi:hypothetical protein
MGYPELDICRFEDGEWAIRQFLKAPVIPAETPWQWVLTGLKHVELSPWVCLKYAQNLDLERKAYWAEVDRKEKEVDEEHAAADRHAQDLAERRFRAVKSNRFLMDRVVRYGPAEMSLKRIARHIPKHFLRSDLPRCRHSTTSPAPHS